MWNVTLMQQGNFIDVFLARHVSGTYARHQEHQMLSCSIWFCAPIFGWVMVLRAAVCGADGAVRHPHRTHKPTQRLSRPSPIQKLGAQNHMLQLNI